MRISTGSLRSFTFLLVLAAIAGCSGRTADPLGPGISSSAAARAAALAAPGDMGLFYPLAVGNRWHYLRQLTIDDPSYPPHTFEFHATVEREITGTEARAGRSYLLEEERTVEDGDEGFSGWTRWRQDRGGLYYYDVCTCDPPASANASPSLVTPASFEGHAYVERGAVEDRARRERLWRDVSSRVERIRLALSRPPEALAARPHPGAADSEVTLLPYPLHVGASWLVRPDIPDLNLRWTVEASELFETPAGRFPAYRIRVTFGSAPDEAFIWYGRAGRLGHSIHSETPVTDEEGNLTGETAIYDEREIVDEVSISR